MKESSPTDVQPTNASNKEAVNEHSCKGDPRLQTVQLGVWTVTTARDKTDVDQRKESISIFSYVPVVRRIFSEVYAVDARALAVLLVCKLVGAVQSTVLLKVMVKQIEDVLVSGKADMASIYRAIFMRLSCVALLAMLDWYFQRTLPKLQSQMTLHFKAKLLEAKLRTNLPTSLRPSSAGKVSARQISENFLDIFSLLGSAVSAGSLITLIVVSAKSAMGGGPLFPLLCVVKPLLSHLKYRDLWTLPHIVHTEHETFLRTKRMSKMTKQEFREEVISADIGEHILGEFKKASKQLDGISTDHPYSQFGQRSTPALNVIEKLAGDLPITYCVLLAAFSSQLSVSSVAILQQSSQNFLSAVSSVLFYVSRFRECANQFQQYFDAVEAPDTDNVLLDGSLAYPLETSSEKGMGFELRDVGFAYPGDPDKLALQGINIAIQPGQLVVIVGANGSGKSTLMKLLTRLYDPASGEILVDDQPLTAYRNRTLRQATAVLSQGHHLFPLSMGENIALGCVERAHDADAVEAAARAGGATGCIAKLRHGMGTVLDPQTRAYGNNLSGKEGEALRERLDELEKPVEVSGGETQRIIAARTFMRFNSGKVRAVLVDEPSSALDPEGELELFDNLRATREGKTMIFVTHRFGHLTKYADLIICMKDGQIVENGSHQDLMQVDGEYRKLYEIQASAFSAPTQKLEECIE